MAAAGFSAEFIDEDPAAFHQRPFDACGRALWVPVLNTRPTLVLGSSQREDTVDRVAVAERGVDIARRRSGGGAVLVSRDDLVWFDVVLNDDDVLWTPDVGRSFDWLGEATMSALQTLGIETTMHRGPMVRSPWSDRVCFAGLGPGELTVDGAKLVGMSQRRTRSTARFQVAILRRWNGPEHRSMFIVDPSERTEADAQLANVATGIEHEPREILESIVSALSAY